MARSHGTIARATFRAARAAGGHSSAGAARLACGFEGAYALRR
jgi:hypothetical protein